MTIYTAYTLEEAERRKDELALYEKAHDTYTEMDFKEAKKLFMELKEADVERSSMIFTSNGANS